MYIPNFQNIVTAGLALSGSLLKPSKVISGSVLDYSVEKCLDDDGNQRCTKPFLVKKSTCYSIKWSTDGAISHTTAEVRDAGSSEIVYYRDTDGDWTPEKGELGNELIKQLVYIDFKPKIAGQHNKTVDYTARKPLADRVQVKTCE